MFFFVCFASVYVCCLPSLRLFVVVRYAVRNSSERALLDMSCWVFPVGYSLMEVPYRILPIGHSLLGLSYWECPIGYCLLGTIYWEYPLKIPYWILLVGYVLLEMLYWLCRERASDRASESYWVCPSGYSLLGIPYWMCPIGHSLLDIAYWACPIEYVLLGNALLSMPYWVFPIGWQCHLWGMSCWVWPIGYFLLNIPSWECSIGYAVLGIPYWTMTYCPDFTLLRQVFQCKSIRTQKFLKELNKALSFSFHSPAVTEQWIAKAASILETKNIRAIFFEEEKVGADIWGSWLDFCRLLEDHLILQIRFWRRSQEMCPRDISWSN